MISENELLNMEIAAHVRDEEEDERDFGDDADDAYDWDKEDRINPEE